MTTGDAATIRDLSRPIWGTQVWQVRLNVQHIFQDRGVLEGMDGLWLDFREFRPKRELGEGHRSVASLYINLRNCGARLEQHGVPVVMSGDPSARVLGEVQRLVGIRLVDVEVKPPGGETLLRFDSALVLSCFPAVSREGDSWVLNTDLGDVLKLGPGPRMTYISGRR